MIQTHLHVVYFSQHLSLNMHHLNDSTYPVIICSRLTIETLEQGVKYVQS